MKIFFILAVMLLPLTCLNSNGQNAPGRADHSFASFWSRFKTAVAKNDKELVASMTKLPFLYAGKERNRAEFIRIFEGLFTTKVKKCLASAKPLKDGDSYELFCAKTIFYFSRVEGQYKFTEIGADD